MTLKLHNTLTRRKEEFRPIDPGHVRMYVCGPTVYDFAHIGNARPVVVFDVLYRLLKRLYPRVSYVRNITDVDDKIMAAAKETGEPIDAITAKFSRHYHDDMAALGALPPDVEPRATGHIPEMIALVERLIARGHAYAADGHVMFSVPSMPDYGRLSRMSRDELVAGARVEVAPYKNDAADFVLWKPSTPDQPGWDSPWGRGRPGWHLECSAMSEKHLGVPFDIHGGGLDLIFPHHENEIAQSRCAHGLPAFARYWLHNGYLTVNGEKMSKSLGNFFTVRQLLDEGHRGEAIRLVLLMAHYRQPMDITTDKFGQALAQLDRLYGALRGNSLAELDYSGLQVSGDFVQGALEDDLNTADAIHFLHMEANEIFRIEQPERKLFHKRSLRRSAAILGLLQQDPEDWLKRKPVVADVRMPVEFSASVHSHSDASAALTSHNQRIEEKILERAAARRAKDYGLADRIRAELAAEGVILEDRPDGTTDWRRA